MHCYSTQYRALALMVLSTAASSMVIASDAGSAPPQVVVPSVAATEACAAAKQILAIMAHRGEFAVEANCSPQADRSGAPPEQAVWALSGRAQIIVAGTQRLVLQRSTEGGPGTKFAVPVDVKVRSAAWVASRRIAAGEWITPDAVVLGNILWPAGAKAVPATETAPSGRARVAMTAGDPVSEDRLIPAGELVAGDRVSVVLRSGGLQLEVPAVMSNGARPGQRARVQLKDRRETLEGVMADAHTVLVER